jgi:protein-S-isoprenylcysteine O-methyltransferase Ste14
MPLPPAFKIGIWNAWLFMSVFLLQMIIIMFINKQVRERSHVPEEARQNKFERYVSIIGNMVWLLALGYSIFLPLQPGTIWFYAGLFVFIIGLVLLAVATFNFIATPVDQLMTKGAYRFSRHPMYLATFFICLGTAIASVSWIFILLTIIMIFCFHKEALIEEKYCLIKYSHAYQKYMDSVPRWIGPLRKIE